MPKISVIIPVYNRELYLEQCLDSVISQTLKDIEIICVDDGSTDNSFEILKKFAQRDERIKLIRQENLGAAVARNKAINIAKGEYLSFIDSDDYVDLNYLEKLYNANNNGKCDVIATVNVKLVDNDLNQNYKNIFIKSKQLNFIERANMLIKSGMSCNKIYKTSFIKNNDICYLEINSAGEDLYFTVFSIILANQINVIHDVSYYYRQNINSLTKIIKNERFYKIIDFCQIVDKKLSELKINIIKKLYWKIIFKKRREYEFFMYYSSMDKNCKKDFLKLLKETYPKDNIKEPTQNLIVSLTSYPKRINYIHDCINSLFNQTIEPEKIILVLAEEEFPNKEKDLPENLINFIKRGLEIQWYSNIKSYKKLIPVLEKYPNKVIVTADDDNIYKIGWLENLYKSYKKKPNMIHCTRAHRIIFDKNKQVEKYKNWSMNISNVNPSFNNFFTGVGGVLYPPNCFYKDILNQKLFSEISKDTDDIWFWAMGVLNNTKINVIQKKPYKLQLINNTQDDALWKINVLDGNNDDNLKKIFDYYPQLLKKLDKRKYIPLNKINCLDLEQYLLMPKDLWVKYKLIKMLKKQKDKTLLWGASLYIEEVLQKNNINNPNIIGIIDKNSKRWGEKINNYMIFSPEQIKNLKADKVLLTIKNSNELIYSDIKTFLEKNHSDIEILPNIFN